MATLRDIAALASRYDASTIFGPLTGSREDKLALLQSSYHRVAAIVHPDRYTGTTDWTLAHETFLRVTQLKNGLESEIRAQGLPGLPGPATRYEEQRRQAVVPYRPEPRRYPEPTRWADPGAPQYPPLPRCACVEYARSNLPDRTLFVESKPGVDYAVVWSQMKYLVEHSRECRDYRSMYASQATHSESIHVPGSFMSFMTTSWRWDGARLNR